jgi:serine/threonine protein kinase
VLWWKRKPVRSPDAADAPVAEDIPPDPAPPAPPEEDPADEALLAFVQLIRRSRLLNAAQINEIKLAWLPDDDPEDLAEALVERGWLSTYQARQLLEGQDQGLVFGPYQVLDLAGEGALGHVYKALHRERRSVVALKVLRPDLRTNEDVLDQFWRERETLASLDHPAFVRACELEPDAEEYYFAMGFVDGIDLGRLLQLAGPLPAGQACDFIRQAALGLQYAFERGVVHRDIKPPNLLVSFTGQLRILDIGSARREWLDPTLTGAAGGALMGTADYIAPEQTLNPQGADTRADIYSLGCTFYHLLTGRPPFPGGKLARKLLDHQQTPPPSLRQARPDLPEGLEAIVQRMLAKKPADRFQTPALVAVALCPFCEGDLARLDLERFRPHGAPAGETLGAGGDDPGTLVDPPPPPRPGGSGQRPALRLPGGSGVRPALPSKASSGQRSTLPGASANGQPAAGRLPGNLAPVRIGDALGREEPLRGSVLDRSTTEIGVLLAEPLEIGTLVRLRSDRPGAADLWVEARVLGCEPERIRWRVDCEFVQKLSWDQLNVFG